MATNLQEYMATTLGFQAMSLLSQTSEMLDVNNTNYLSYDKMVKICLKSLFDLPNLFAYINKRVDS